MHIPRRTLFGLFKSKPSTPPNKSPQPAAPPPAPILSQDDLFHPLAQSPFEDLREKAERIRTVSICPVSVEKYNERVRPLFDCPDCGWPTHRSEERWEEGKAEHSEVCERLREVNEDEHDLRSGRRFTEFENMPRDQPFDQAISFANWDTLLYTRQFPSIDSERSLRHVSKVLTYPMTVAAALHQNGPFTTRNGRVTREGRRSMAALHSILHLPPGGSEDTAIYTPQPPIRIIVMGARAESTLPPQHWQQLTWMFPRSIFHLYFVGPEVGLPLLGKFDRRRKDGYDFSERDGWGCPAHTLHVSDRLSITSLRANHEEVHSQLGPFDPYTDVFFSFSPGLGFPDQPGLDPKRKPKVSSDDEGGDAHWNDLTTQPLVQAQTTWRLALKKVLATKCATFFTAFSPLDLQRDVSALYGTNPPSFRHHSKTREFPDYVGLPTAPVEHIEGVTDEFELIVTPGKNEFGSQKWEIAEWDVRVAVKANWGLWGIRGKKYEVVEGQDE